MNSDVFNQARYVFDTVRMLQARVASRPTASNSCYGNMSGMHELTIPQMHMLHKVRELGGATIKDLAVALHVSAPSVSAMVERLVEVGMVTREQSRVDRREVIVQLAPEGEHALSVMEKQILESIVELLEEIGPVYAQMWCNVYERIREVLNREQAGRQGDEGQEVESV